MDKATDLCSESLGSVPAGPHTSHWWQHEEHVATIEWLHERTEHLDIFLFFPPITQWCSISEVLFTGGRECQILVL